MSTATELAELEAQIAEAGLSDEEATVVKGGVDQGVPIAEAIALVLEARSEANAETASADHPAGDLTDEQLAQLDKALEKHTRSVRGILGEQAEQLATCETCGGMGLAPPGDPMPEPKVHPYFKACETCNALGQVLTGSMVAGNVMRACPECGGRGYLEALDQSGAALAAGGGSGVPLLVPSPAPAAELEAAGTNGDAAGPRFGRPAWMGDPSLGQ